MNETNPPSANPDAGQRAAHAEAVACIARSYLASFEQRDVAKIAAHVSSDFVNEHTSALGSGCVGKAAYIERLPDFLGDMIELRYAVEKLVVEGRNAAVFYTMTAKWQGRAAVSIRGVQHLVVNDGLIVHRTDYWDSSTFLAQADESARETLARFGVTG
ncbi:MAG: ester cyclase [Actinobacteria bacterium]|nr:ester cyclase [Actinomycetota bacterium]